MCELGGQAESCEQFWFLGEADDPVDAIVVDREDHDAVGAEVSVCVFLGVGGEGWLAVGAGGDELDPVEVAVHRGGREEHFDLFAALEACCLGWHRQQGVVCEQGGEGWDVDCCPGLLEALHYPCLAGAAAWRMDAGECAVEPFSLEPFPPALEGAVDGGY